MINNVFIDKFDSAFLDTTVAKVVPSINADYAFFSVVESFFIQEDVGIAFCFVSYDVKLCQTLTHFGYYLVSSRITYRMQKITDAVIFLNSKFTVIDSYIYSPNDIKLHDLAADLAVVSHYGKDPFISRNGAFKLYVEWIKNSFAGYAQKIFVAVDAQGQCAGMVSLRPVGDDLAIDLLGVHQAYRAQGLGGLLLYHAKKYAQELGKSLTVTTQVENSAANRLYQKQGFLSESVELVYHKILIREKG